MLRCIPIAFLAVLLCGSLSGEGTPLAGSPPPHTAGADSTDVAPADTGSAIDPTSSVDSTSILDSILMLHPDVDPDTLTEAQRMLLEFETRYQLHQQQRQPDETKPVFSYFDSLACHLVTTRWDLREDINRSFYHDAGDYFRSDPGFFVLEPQVTPMRKTVQPYGLAGDRLGILVDERQMTPFEHVLEPDGLTDMNDIPTALDHHVAILPGPVGLLLGAKHSVATLLTRPGYPVSTSSESTFLVDKGSFGYSYARGRYSKRFINGREIDMSIGYRNADGQAWGRSDDAYHYSGDFYFPFTRAVGFRASGCLYDRHGRFVVRPHAGGGPVRRDRSDHFARLSVAAHNDSRSLKYEFGYTRHRQGSGLDGSYTGRFNRTGHGVFVAREWIGGSTIVKTEVDIDYLEYNDWYETHSRLSGGVALNLARLTQPCRFAVTLRQQHVEDYRFLPVVSAMMSRETEKLFLMFSLAYSERAPSLHELHLRNQEAQLYGADSIGYADHGNSDLVTERQVMGSCEVELGSLCNNLGISVTGGRITDGIDWQTRVDGGRIVFSPYNGDVDFANVTADTRVSLANLLRLKTGGSYHFLDYKSFDNKPYTPEYQLFSGAELHLFWSQKLIHLYAYGEVVYTGQYDGYIQRHLGDVAVVNVKLSFRMGDFRFHWVSQNTISTMYYPRDNFFNPGRYNYYGFTWDFLD